KERNIFPIISELAIRATLGILERTVRVGLPPGLRA
ncbi:MAG: polyketide cyclase, partial [Acidimicrobiales bacterium]